MRLRLNVILPTYMFDLLSLNFHKYLDQGFKPYYDFIQRDQILDHLLKNLNVMGENKVQIHAVLS